MNLAKKNITPKGKLVACQAVARLAITTNPVMAFPGQQTYEAIKCLLVLLKQEQQVDRSSLMNFEALMALTNIASIDEGHRNKITTTPEMVYCIESLALEDHELIRRAAVQLICNLLMCQKYRDLYKESVEKDQTCDRLKLLILMCQEDDDETRSAAAGALATLTCYKKFENLFFKKIFTKFLSRYFQTHFITQNIVNESNKLPKHGNSV